ncbi:S66 peptidase family protein [Pelodictyon luteolum]|uniref:Muramoyltetrapeptide carboxypeptidase n=1 Tax=Chlorobium luteolum (strain DSM 273 / BCRC 81028 / 2530) TaxID=319225 RepID=Q3B6X0_CHLL3|nr:LD-carboxypeptidase [Pelodictyon luteolum]ABB22911.1 Muramoyltetrapeptide carboxypeptidase [Pelodictyon luteolum DSM 273]
MTQLLPHALAPGETIGLISPSSHSTRPERIEQAVSYLEKNGYRVKPSRHLNRISTDPEVADREKLYDLHAMFQDPAVRAVICLRGGAGASRLLGSIDYELIRKHPKIFIGYSDITALSLAILAKTGLVNFSGPMLATELHDPTPCTEEHFWGMLTSPLFALSIRNCPAHRISVLRPGTAEGPLIGGNLTMLSSMVGTPFLPSLDGALLFLEDVNEASYRIDRMLAQLLNAGQLEGCRAILFGQFSNGGVQQEEEDRLLRIFNYYADRCRNLGPVVTGLSYGHVADLMTLPVGAHCRVEVSGSGAFSLGATAPVITA